MNPHIPTSSTSAPAVPSWNEIFREIAIQLKTRNQLVTKRVFWIALPTLVLIALFEVVRGVPSASSWLKSVIISDSLFFVNAMTIVVAVLAVSMIILMAIFKAEQTVWLDSYFDGKHLTPQESWNIAKKLYFPWARLQSRLFFRYYVWILVSIIVAFSLAVYVFITSDIGPRLSSTTITVTMSLYVILCGMGLVVWTRSIKIKTSYAPFIFLDRYEGVLSPSFWKEFFLELDRLNEVSKGEAFRKNVLMELGADAAMSLVEYISGIMGAAGVPAALRFGGKEVAHRIIYYAKKTGQYVLYRFALKAVHGEVHRVNEYVYGLKG